MKSQTLLSIVCLLFFGIALISAQPVNDTTATTAPGKDSAAPRDTIASPSPAAAVKTAAPADTSTERRNVLLIKSKKDTILLVTDKDEITSIISSVSRSVKKSRMQGYGGAGGYGQRLAAVDMAPVKELVDNDWKLKGVSFPTLEGGFTLLSMDGGLGYGGLGNGIRIGGGGWGGSRKYTSSRFREHPDSAREFVAQLKVGIGFGGFLIEKAMVHDNWNWIVGGMIGGGGLSVEKSVMDAEKISAFSGSGGTDGSETARTALMSMELHGAATYTIVPWMHVGGEFSSMFYSSISGFELTTGNGFFGVLPSIGVRIIFGNLG